MNNEDKFNDLFGEMTDPTFLAYIKYLQDNLTESDWVTIFSIVGSNNTDDVKIELLETFTQYALEKNKSEPFEGLETETEQQRVEKEIAYLNDLFNK